MTASEELPSILNYSAVFGFIKAKRFGENNVRLVVDVADSPGTADFFLHYKQTLKEPFWQIDLWIISYEIRIT